MHRLSIKVASLHAAPVTKKERRGKVLCPVIKEVPCSQDLPQLIFPDLNVTTLQQRPWFTAHSPLSLLLLLACGISEQIIRVPWYPPQLHFAGEAQLELNPAEAQDRQVTTLSLSQLAARQQQRGQFEAAAATWGKAIIQRSAIIRRRERQKREKIDVLSSLQQ